MSTSLERLFQDPSSYIDAPCEICGAKLPKESLYPVSGNRIQDTIESAEGSAWRRLTTRDGWSIGDEKALVVLCPRCEPTSAGAPAITVIEKVGLRP